MTKIPKGILKKLKDREAKEAKMNYTFRLTVALMDQFRSKCEKNDVSMASVVEEMIRHFNENE